MKESPRNEAGSAAGIDAERSQDTRQLEVRRWEGAYLRQGHFNQDAASNVFAADRELLATVDAHPRPEPRHVERAGGALRTPER